MRRATVFEDAMSNTLPTLSMTISALHACATVRRSDGDLLNEREWGPVPRIVDVLKTHDEKLKKALALLEAGAPKNVEAARRILDEVLVGPFEREVRDPGPS